MDVRVIGDELQHKLLKVVLDRRWLKNVRSNCAKKEYRTKVWKLLNEDIKTKFSEKMKHTNNNNSTQNFLIEPKYADDIAWITISKHEVECVKANIPNQLLKYKLQTNKNKTEEIYHPQQQLTTSLDKMQNTRKLYIHNYRH